MPVICLVKRLCTFSIKLHIFVLNKVPTQHYHTLEMKFSLFMLCILMNNKDLFDS